MRSLDEILDGLTVEVQPFAICEARGDSAIDAGSREHATLHYVLSGAGTFSIFGLEDVEGDTGTLLITPARVRHGMRANRAAFCEKLNCAPLGTDWQFFSTGEGSCGIVVACSDIAVSYRGIEGLFDYLQAPLISRLESADPLRLALEQLLRELAQPLPGSRSLVRALMQQCLIYILRQTNDRSPEQLQWLAAVNDERLWRAVTAIFDAPGAPHTLAGLSEIAQMSRSSFADHFKRAFGRSPIDLLKQARLQMAAQLLISSEKSIKAIARDSGYDSRSYFSRAFHSQFGESPVAYRRHRRQS